MTSEVIRDIQCAVEAAFLDMFGLAEVGGNKTLNGDPIVCQPEAYRALMRQSSPSLHALHNAGWRSGFQVNGVGST